MKSLRCFFTGHISTDVNDIFEDKGEDCTVSEICDICGKVLKSYTRYGETDEIVDHKNKYRRWDERIWEDDDIIFHTPYN